MFCVEAPSANRSVEGCLRESGILMLLRACLPINCKRISSERPVDGRHEQIIVVWPQSGWW